MKPTSRRLLAALLSACLAASVSLAEQAIENGLYRLERQATYTFGCYPPCMCPIFSVQGVFGVFRAEFVGREADGWVEVYRISGVNFWTDESGAKVRYVGSGTYRIGGDFAYLQRLELDLKEVTPSGEQRHFDSGWVQVGGGSGLPFDLIVSVNGQFCFDYVFDIQADRVQPSEIIPYQLKRGSTYQFGCWEPCACPISGELRTTGRFGLVPIRSEFPIDEFAVVDVGWQISWMDPAAPRQRVTGTGIYRIVGDFTLTQQMLLDLRIDGGAVQHYHNSDGDFPAYPRIDVTVSMNDMFCYDQVFTLHASPARAPAIEPGTVGERVERD